MTARGNTITIKRGGEIVAERPLAKEMVIGRSPDADVQLEDPQMSRAHATVKEENGRFFITDKSTNGVVVNGQRIPKNVPTELLHGAIVSMACFELHFFLEADQVVPETQEIELAPSLETSISETMEKIERGQGRCCVLGELDGAKLADSVWSDGEVELEVADIISETHDVKTFRLRGPEGMLFSYKPGQFVNLTVEIDGKPVKRSYSVSSSPSRPHTLEMTVKRTPGGLVSNWLNDELKLGDRLVVKGPMGKFSCFEHPSQKLFFIAAGSGCTPIMSMARWLVDTAEQADVILLVSARTPADIIFRKELEVLAARHPGFRVFFTVTGGWSSTDGWTGLTGRVNDDMLRLVAPDLMDRQVFMCGPKPFADATKEALRQMGFDLANLHTESFGGRPKPKDGAAPSGTAAPKAIPTPPPAATPPPAPAAPEAATPAVAVAPQPAATSGKYQVTFQASGVTVRTDGEDMLLDVADEHGVELDSSCRAGTCLTCKVRLVAGEVEMDLDADLDEEERAEGWILACSSTPKSDVVLDA